MSLVIENGNIVKNSNSFITEDYFSSFLSLRRYSVSDPVSALVLAYDFMLALPWKVSQKKAFEVFDDMKKGQAEIAYRLSFGLDLAGVAEAEVKVAQVEGAVKMEYFKGADAPTTAIGRLGLIPAAESLLKPYMQSVVKSSVGYLDRA